MLYESDSPELRNLGDGRGVHIQIEREAKALESKKDEWPGKNE